MHTARTIRTIEKGDWRALFLTQLAATGNVSAACKAAGVGRTFVYGARKADQAFAADWDDALDQAADGLELEAHRRAVKGVLKPVYQQGKKVGAVREYSDTLLIVLLKAARPEKYRERYEYQGAVDVTMKGYTTKEASPDAWDDATGPSA